MNQITVNTPLDMHIHLRDNDMLDLVAPLCAKYFSGALIMPNLIKPITTKKNIIEYRNRITKAIHKNIFTPYMTLFFQKYDKKFLNEVKNDILAIKLYPSGITTNSENGIKEIDTKNLHHTLQAMSDLNIPLCIHGETNGFVLDREKEFIPIYENIARDFPKLKIIMEHITTKDSVELLDKYDNIYATITLHHLLITLDDVIGGVLRPHLFCKPIPKKDIDRSALLKVALQGHPKVMFGSDSAPHPQHKKESCGCAAGVFTSPISVQVLVELFENHKCLENLNKFLSQNAINIYNITPPQKDITLIKKEFKVPSSYYNKTQKVIPMYANESLKWSIEE